MWRWFLSKIKRMWIYVLIKNIFAVICGLICGRKPEITHTRRDVHVPTQKTVGINQVPSGFRVDPSIVEAGPGDTIDFTAVDRDAILFFPHPSEIFTSTDQLVTIPKGSTVTRTIKSSPENGLFPYAIYCFDSSKTLGASESIGLFAEGYSTPLIHIEW